MCLVFKHLQMRLMAVLTHTHLQPPRNYKKVTSPLGGCDEHHIYRHIVCRWRVNDAAHLRAALISAAALAACVLPLRMRCASSRIHLQS